MDIQHEAEFQLRYIRGKAGISLNLGADMQIIRNLACHSLLCHNIRYHVERRLFDRHGPHNIPYMFRMRCGKCRINQHIAVELVYLDICQAAMKWEGIAEPGNDI